jgi:hypothetical protein
LTVAGVEPLVGVTDSHEPPDAAAVICNAAPVLVIDRFCVPDVVLPDAYVNVKVPGATFSDGFPDEALVTARLTAIFCGELDAPEAVTVRVPL